MSRLSSILVGIACLLGDVSPCFADSDTLIESGRRLYRTAARQDGTWLRALVQTDVTLPGSAAACMNCHRRSGIGISEGGSRSLNLTAPVLFAASDKPPLRPAYTDATLIRAIVAGIAADGRALSPTMPRYELDSDDSAALLAYLHSLAATTPTGVSDTDIHIATIVSSIAPPQEREAAEAVVRRYVELKNSETRHESARADAADRNYYGRSSQRAYRTWKLHVWTLLGPESTWPKQLASLYAETTPFVILSGTAGPGWPTVHRFCERHEIPCILPLSNFPAVGEADWYSLYFSSGSVLEAGVTARHIIDSGLSTNAKILVIYPHDAMGLSAFGALRSYLEDRDFRNISAHTAPADRSLSGRKLRALLKAERPDVLVGWMSANVISELAADPQGRSILPNRLYTAESFSDWTAITEPGEFLRERIHHVYPYSISAGRGVQFPREHLWLKQQGLSALDALAAAKVLYACRILGMALSNIQSNFSREYLLETLEHALDGTQLTSVFPRTSLGPGQRILTHGAYVVDLSGRTGNIFGSPAWIQP